MPLSDAQKIKLKEMPDDERSELLEFLGGKKHEDSDLLKTVELLQAKVDKMEKSSTRKGSEERRKGSASKSWFQEFFGVS